jgi:prevent-host-death family protein
MPRIIPIKDLKNTNEISKLCKQSNEPVFITKNGYGDMVIMSIETYEKTMFMNNVYKKLEVAESEVAEGKTKDGFEVINDLRSKYEL